MLSSKIYPACHNIANDIEPRINLKPTDKHAAEGSKAVCWDVERFVCNE